MPFHTSRATHGRHITPKQRRQRATTPRTSVMHGFKEAITCAREALRQPTCTAPLMPSPRLYRVLRTLLLPFTGHGWHVHVHLAQHSARAGTSARFKDAHPHTRVTPGHVAGTRTARPRPLHSPRLERVLPPRYSCSHATTEPPGSPQAPQKVCSATCKRFARHAFWRKPCFSHNRRAARVHSPRDRGTRRETIGRCLGSNASQTPPAHAARTTLLDSATGSV